ncbi:hypothetical protein CesoFtcFv8_008877 [Champsocephalus esox]|uniref:Ig-like domain-containing protein n=1 Tax=Champsocephalus esox TaxID=159716 RepID=A0AAN8H1T7_9TELE|nr:hypothetical protein CesoFtcFv8_008877 [Champsocephalus esox]
MKGIQYLAFLGTLFITQTGFVCSDMEFLERSKGGSVVFPCEVEPRDPSPYGVYLKRSWLNQIEVLFQFTKTDFTVEENYDKKRISVSGDSSTHSLNVTISQLSASDTDRYYCEFVVDNPSSEDIRIRGKTEFFLLVKAGGQCDCSRYSMLLYALSSAVVVLLLLLLLGFVVIYKGKARRSVSSHPQAPIYEEMTGSRKRAPRNLEEMEPSEYTNCSVKKSCPQNHYESPRGAPCPRTN